MSADAIVFAACCVVAVFALGLEIGRQHVPRVCPVVPGQQVISTLDRGHEQVCTYADATGRALRKARL